LTLGLGEAWAGLAVAVVFADAWAARASSLSPEQVVEVRAKQRLVSVDFHRPSLPSPTL
jgi:hypothetical protein